MTQVSLLPGVMERDGKRLGLSNLQRAVPTFLLYLVVMLPLELFLILPLTLLWFGVARVVGIVSGGKKEKGESAKNMVSSQNAPSPQVAPREFDIVLFGATGFTGRMAAHYLARNYLGELRIGIAGRRKEALEEIRQEMHDLAATEGNGRRGSDVAIFIVNTLDENTFRDVVSNCKVVATTVGPFAKYGNEIVRVCAEVGTHYCDITGETDWVRGNIAQYQDLAEKSGARIVSFCGHDCIPWDLSVHALAKYFREEENDEMVHVSCFDEIRSSPSGGTLDTIFHSLDNRVKLRTHLDYDPLLHLPSGDASGENDRKSPCSTTAKNASFLGYSSVINKWIGPFVMAMVMGNCVRRSNAVNQYSKRLVYNEQIVFPNFFAGFVYMTQMIMFANALFFPPLKYLLRNFVLPAPGQGPSEADMDRGFLRLHAVGTGSKGGKAHAVMYFGTDPGYRDTARMLMESAVTLAKGDDLPGGGGVHTPATGLGAPLLRRLCDSGTQFELSAAN
eukprot:CAMPEP_0119143678 /NCGR_PEP_ID=MMETSP1310-20130426/34669_1 /TAXON_ID=464262 /ORGANISM="Genus nov. species nov., Strain RCC2339" /LENGTH=503 /DNA_ID=CAMNT_0007135323 /DNA_START=40 /DNA_END=1551 /DNA_ORIENTATION=+